MRVDVDFTGRVVLVTGGTRGVGRGLCESFARRGAIVVTCGRKPPETPYKSAVEFDACDVRDADAVSLWIDGIVARHGRLDVAINNAGGAPYALAADASPRYHTSIITLNLLAPFHVSQKANSVMQTQPDGGSIIMISSVSGIRPSPGTAAYGAAKAGLVNLASTLAIEWAPKVRVNCLTAGMVETESSYLHYGDEAGIASVNATVPMGHMASTDEIADVCAFLASPLARYVTGANLVAHGGGEKPAFLGAANVNKDH